MTQPLRVGIKLSQDAPIESYKADLEDRRRGTV